MKELGDSDNKYEISFEHAKKNRRKIIDQIEKWILANGEYMKTEIFHDNNEKFNSLSIEKIDKENLINKLLYQLVDPAIKISFNNEECCVEVHYSDVLGDWVKKIKPYNYE
jgi:hypothetical protein